VLLIPDKILNNLNDITTEMLKTEGIRGLILDIDYTLAPKSMALPEETVKQFVEQLKSAGIMLYLISNNHKNRVSIFAHELGLPYIFNGLKPLPWAFLKALREMGLEKNQVVAVGDQIYTDVCGAHMAGIKAWLVLPAWQVSSCFYKLRSGFEKPFISRYYKIKGDKLK